MYERRIIALAWPAVAEMMLYMLLDFVDMAFVGRLGAAALAAVGLGGQIYFSVLMVFSALASGATALIARSVGARDDQRVSQVAGQALCMALCLGAGLSVLLVVFANNIISCFYFEPAVLSQAGGYLKTTSTAAAFAMVLFVSSGIFRGAGLTKVPMLVAGLTNLIHIVLDYSLIFGKLGLPALGVRGAAIATACAQVFGCLTILFLMLSGLTPLHLRWSDILQKWDVGLSRTIIRLSIPAGCEEGLNDFGRLVSSFMLAGLGTLPFATHQVVLTAESISYMPGYGFAVAAMSLLGRSLGAGKPEEGRHSCWESLRLALLVMCGIAMLFLFIPAEIIGIFTHDPGVVTLGSLCLRIAALEQVGIAVEMVLSGALRGAGDTRTPMLVSFVGTWGLRIPLLYLSIFIFKFGLPVVWVIFAIDWILRAIFLTFWFRLGRWAEIKL